MELVATNTFRIDVEHLGNARVIASCLLEGPGGPALVDPGPASTLSTLERKLKQHGLQIADLHALLLTHIHLDHAGATGSLVRMNPRLRVFVHERGAVHMVQPAKLLESARRLYGDEMDRLWGEFLSVPADNVHALKGGEKLQLGGRTLDVAYTPGHASHHVSYFDQSTGFAFTGDTTGIRIANQPGIMPPTPPPDINLELWEESLDLILSRKPERLFLTHFGPAFPPDEHIAEFRAALRQWGELVQKSLDTEGTDDQRAARFAEDVFRDLCRRFPEDVARLYVKGAPPDQCWYGLARYWRKRAQAAISPSKA